MTTSRDGRRHAASSVLLVGLAALGVVATMVAVSRARSEAKDRDKAAASAAAERLSVALETSIALLRGSDALAADGLVTEEEFRAFSGDVVPSSDFTALAYTQIVDQADRAVWEAEVGVPMIDLDGTTSSPAAARDPHVVVRFVDPVSDLTRGIIGFDIAGDPVRAGGVAAALSHDEGAIVGPIKLAATAAPGVFVIHAVSTPDGAPIGFLSAGVSSERLVELLSDVPHIGRVGMWIDGQPLTTSSGEGRTIQLDTGGHSFTVRTGDERDASLLLPFVVGAGTAILCILAGRSLVRWRRSRRRTTRAAERERELAQLSIALAEAGSTERVVELVVEHAPAILDAAHLAVARRDLGEPTRMLVAHDRSLADPVAERFAIQDLNAHLPVTDCVRTGTTLAIRTRAEFRTRFPNVLGPIEQLGIQSGVWVPFSVGPDRTHGVVGFSWLKEPSTDVLQERVQATQLIAEMTGRAMERALTQEILEVRTAMLSELAQRLTATRSTGEIERLIARMVPPLLGVQAAALGHGGAELTGEVRSYAAPTPDGEDLHVQLRPGTEWSPILESITRAIIELIESAWARARDHEHEHSVLQQLQRTLLAAAPRIDGLDIAVGYRSAIQAVGIGGDWYSVIERPDRVHLVIGDVAGHGPGAVAVMAEVKSVMRHLLSSGEPIEAVVQDADAVLRRRNAFASIVVASIDKVDHQLAYVNAGHLSPILRTPEGSQLLSDVHRPWLGVEGEPRPASRVRFEPGSTLVLYTDGLIEDRRTPIDTSIADLAEHIARTSDGAEGLVEELIADRTANRTPLTVDDDIAVIAVRRTG